MEAYFEILNISGKVQTFFLQHGYFCIFERNFWRMIFIKKRREQKRILKTKKISGETYENQRKYEKHKKKERKLNGISNHAVGVTVERS